MQAITRFLSMVCGRNVRRAGALVAIAALAGAGCATLTKDNSSSYLVVAELNAAAGAEPDKYGGSLLSDVATDTGGAFPDIGKVKLTLGMKDASLTPTSANFITTDHFRVEFERTDGGTAVPAPFDSAFTVTVTAGEATGGFILIPNSAKFAAPLDALAFGGEIHTIATITFFGKDQAGRTVSALGHIGVNFANYADPK